MRPKREDEGAFTLADDVATLAIEVGLSLEPWQFDAIARIFPDPA